MRRIRDSPGSYPSRPLLDSSDVHRLPGWRARPGVLRSGRGCFSRAGTHVSYLRGPAVAHFVISSMPRLPKMMIMDETYTYPDNSIEFSHGHLFCSVNCCSNLLLVFLRQKRQYLCNYSVQSLCYLRLKKKKNISFNLIYIYISRNPCLIAYIELLIRFFYIFLRSFLHLLACRIACILPRARAQLGNY